MRKNHQIFLLSFVVFMVGLFLVGCSSNEPASNEAQNKSIQEEGESTGEQDQEEVSEEEKYGGKVTVRFPYQPTSLGYPPDITPPSAVLPIVQPAVETLGRYNPDGTIGPWLATDWELDPESKTITVHLREGVKFHDGTDFNAEAVKWSVETVSKERGMDTFERVEAVDSHTVRFHLKKWATGQLEDIMWIYPITSPTAFEKMGKDGVMFHPVGTGPFKFESYEPDQYVRYVRFENYWQEGLPYLDELEIRIIVDDNTALNAFLGREIDVVVQLPGDLIEQYLDSTEFDVVPLETTVGLEIRGLVANSLDENSPLADVNVRKAISYAINREEIAQSLFKGLVIPTNQLAMEGTANYTPDLEPFEYNPEKAKQLLAEAGYPDGFSTKLIGQPPEALFLQAVQGYLADVGITAEVEIYERGRYLSMVMSDGWEGLATYVATSSNDISSQLKYHFSENATIWGPFTIRPQDMLDLMDKYDQEIDPDIRAEIAHEVQKVVFEKYHLVNLVYIQKIPYLKHKHVQDPGFYTSRTALFTPEKMWVKK